MPLKSPPASLTVDELVLCMDEEGDEKGDEEGEEVSSIKM
jgi:hypothetical protein